MSTLPALDYNYNELEPHIDAKTMEIHHSKHHQAYISKYDAAIEGTSLEQKRVFDVLADFASVSDDVKGAVRNNGGRGTSIIHYFGKSLARTVVGHQVAI